VQVGRQAMADRYTYVPLVGVFVAGVWTVAALLGKLPVAVRRAVALAAILATLVPATLATRAQAAYWRDDHALWAHALEVRLGLDAPRARDAAIDLLDDRALTTLLALVETRDAGESPVAAAGAPVARTTRLSPPAARQIIGRLFLRHGRLDEAIVTLREAAALAPRDAQMQSDLGDALSSAGRDAEAAVSYQEALRLDPSLAAVQNNLGLSLARTGRIDEAVAHFTEAVRLQPGLVDAYRNLGLALANLGRYDEARRAFEAVVRLAPSDAAARRALAALAGK
jgi:Flp pilus assembly protein TadD